MKMPVLLASLVVLPAFPASASQPGPFSDWDHKIEGAPATGAPDPVQEPVKTAVGTFKIYRHYHDEDEAEPDYIYTLNGYDLKGMYQGQGESQIDIDSYTCSG